MRLLAKILVTTCLVVLFSISGAILQTTTSGAVRTGVGFFSGESADDRIVFDACGHGPLRGHYVLCGGVPNYSGNKEGFISFIEGKLRGNDMDHAGAAFIVYTMLGYDPGNDLDGPSSSEMEEWKRRLRSPSIGIHQGNVVEDINSQSIRNPDGSPDVMFKNENVRAESLIFTHNGEHIYYIKRICANPLGDMPGLPEAAEWYIDGQSQVRVGSSGAWKGYGGDVKPGDRLWWRHTLRNEGPDDMDISVGYGINPGDDSPRGSWQGRRNQTTTINGKTNYQVTQNDVDKYLCESIWWEPNSWEDGGTGESDEACVFVPYNYSLTPSISVPNESIQEGVTHIDNIISNIDNSGPTKSREANYAVVRFIVRGDETTNIAGGDNIGSSGAGGWACGVVDALRGRTGLNLDVASCAGGELVSRTGEVVPYPGGVGHSFSSNDISGLDLVKGDRLCYMTMVNNYDPNVGSGLYRYSKPACIRVNKRPKVQFWGADVRSVGQVRTSRLTVTGNTYGAWAEYAILSGQSVVSSSGAGLSSGEAGRPGVGTELSYNKLTFSNDESPNFGSFGSIAPSVIPSFAGTETPIESEISVGDISSGNYRQIGNLVVNGGNVSPGKRLVISSGGTVTIRSNITYDNTTYSSFHDLPQVIIIARDIVIAPEVTDVDAWLIAQSGYISTCGAINVASWLENITDCSQQLRINGPVVANRLYLKRTYGSERGILSAPAEIINTRPDVYMWGYSQSVDSGAIRTMYSRELPPRF